MKTLTIILIYYLDIGCSSYFFKVLSGYYKVIIHSKTVIGKSTIFPTVKNGRGLYLTRVLLND